MTLQIERLRTIEQLEAFVAGSAPVDCKPLDGESAYDFVRRTLVAFDYHRLGKADRGKVRRKHLRDDVKTPNEKLKSLSGATPRFQHRRAAVSGLRETAPHAATRTAGTASTRPRTCAKVD